MDNVDNHLVHIDVTDIYDYLADLKNISWGRPEDTYISPFEESIFVWRIKYSNTGRVKAIINCEVIVTHDEYEIDHFNKNIKNYDELFYLVTLVCYVNQNRCGYVFLPLGKCGNLLERGGVGHIDPTHNNDVLLKEWAESVMSDSIIVYHHSISLMNCKNIELKDEPLTRQQRRRKERKNEIIYKVLAIKEGSKSTRYLDHGHSGDKHAYHLCRGHFKTYTDDAPLFGRLTGTYWWPAHVRGSKEFGEVVKDYQVG